MKTKLELSLVFQDDTKRVNNHGFWLGKFKLGFTKKNDKGYSSIGCPEVTESPFLEIFNI